MKMPPWSYSHLTAYAQCPRKYHHLYVIKDIPFESSPEQERGKLVHAALEARIRHGTSLPEDMKDYDRFIPHGFVATAEKRLGITAAGEPCDFFDASVWGRGVADCIVWPIQHGPNKTAAVLLDWKTGKRREDPFELQIQGVLVRAHFPETTRVIGYYVWLGDGAIGQRHDVSETVRCLGNITAQVRQIERGLETGHMPPKQGPLCKWCKVKRCEFNPEKER